jgi:uncharacterized membrane protein YgcG
MKHGLLRALAACLALGFLLPAAADERILAYRSDISVQADGQLLVTETIRVRAEGQDIRRGIYRDFPTRYRDRFGNHYRVDFEPLSVRRDGQPEAWHSEQRSNGVRLYAGRADRMLNPGVHEYELVFRTNRQLGFFETHDELYFSAVGNGWTFPVDHAVATVTLPFDLMPERLSLNSYTGFAGSRESAATAEILLDGRVRFETTRPLAPNEGLTISIGWPKGLIPEPGLERRISWFLADNDGVLVLLLGLLLPLAWYLWAWNKVGRDPRKGVIFPRYEPPTGLSPAACRYVRSMSFHRDAFTAAIISLAIKGYLTIEEQGKDFTLVRKADATGAPLSAGEKALLTSLLPLPLSSIEMKAENHASFQAARKALQRALKREYEGRLFHLNRVYIVPAALLSVGAFVIALFLDAGIVTRIVYAFLTVVLHVLFIYLLRAPTRGGRQVMDEIEGFKMYLGTAERQRLDRMQSPTLTAEVFESFLPFAYALGVENRWCDRFAAELPAEVRQDPAYTPAWYSGRYHGLPAVHHLGSGFGSSFGSAISAASSPPGSSSGGGGGGSSGGGGGGGGGGGW